MIFRQQNARSFGILMVAAVALAVAGCKNADSQIVGNWKDSKGMETKFNADHTFSQGTGQMSSSGKWSFKDKKVSVSIDTIMGKPVDEFLKSMADMMSKFDPKANAADEMKKAKDQLANLSFDLSEDGKTMTLNTPAGAKSAAGAAATTLTKEETKS